MLRYREPLDVYDIKPSGMVAYLRQNGWHFNKRMCEFAAKMMRKKNGNSEEPIEPYTKEQVESILTKYGIEINNKADYDFVYIADMVKADFWGSSIRDEQNIALYIKDVIDDADQADGFIFNRFYADCVRGGIGIPWEELI